MQVFQARRTSIELCPLPVHQQLRQYQQHLSIAMPHRSTLGAAARPAHRQETPARRFLV